MEQPKPSQSNGNMPLWNNSGVVMRQKKARTVDEARTKSLMIDLPSAPLWRNAPTHHACHANRRSTPPAVIDPVSAFQQSLRTYPAPKDAPDPNSPKSVQQVSSRRNSLKQTRPASLYSRREDEPSQVNHVTNLDGEQTSSFYLDYLDNQSYNSNPMNAGAFNHRKFMEMFRAPDSGHIADGSNVNSSMPSGGADSGSLPYTVNNSISTGRSVVGDSLTSGDQMPFYLAQDATEKPSGTQRNIFRSGSSAQARPKESAVIQRNHSTKNMENKNSRSTSNLNQRLQLVAERRAQIEEAKRERVQRQIEQVARVAPPPNSSQNVSIAFGSSRARNIDLTRPLVNPITHTPRPKSEIFPSTFYAAPSTSVVDSPAPRVYAKDDTHYPTRSAAPQQQSATTPSLMTQSVSVHSFQSTPYRAALRHDPELVPAKQRYIFRDYTPFSPVSPPKKENSMTSSMMSTKSFQVNSSAFRSPFVSNGLQNRPKKSWSMNRLDQLAQPRRRVEPKVPTSASFIRTREPIGARKAANEDESSRANVKPVPPPKTFLKRSSKPVPTSEMNASVVKSAPVKPSIAPKPRPVSQVEPMTKVVEAAAVVSENVPAGPALTQEEKDEKLAEYKRALAEKKAMFLRKQQEEQQAQSQAPTKKAVIVKPQTEVKPQEEEEHSSSSSSSSSSDSEDDNESSVANKPLELSVTDKVSEQKSPIPEPATAQPELINLAPSEPESTESKQASDNLMTTSLTGDLATLTINPEEDKLSNASSMTASFDASLLSAYNNDNNNANNGSGQRPQSSTMALTKEQLERSAILLEQERQEREKRKSRVQEILKRTTRKEGEKKEAGSSDSKSNGGDSNGEPATENGVANGHGKYNGINGDHSPNGHLNHHQDMKNFVSENEQSLPPTNGF